MGQVTFGVTINDHGGRSRSGGRLYPTQTSDVWHGLKLTVCYQLANAGVSRRIIDNGPLTWWLLRSSSQQILAYSAGTRASMGIGAVSKWTEPPSLRKVCSLPACEMLSKVLELVGSILSFKSLILHGYCFARTSI
jgi:hypothetical protein